MPLHQRLQRLWANVLAKVTADEAVVNAVFTAFLAWAIISVLTLLHRSSSPVEERPHGADALLARMSHEIFAFKYPALAASAHGYRLLDPNDAHAEQGHRMFDAGHLEAAAASFRAAIRQRPSDPHAWSDLATVLGDRRMSDRAKNARDAALCIERAHALDPEHIDDSIQVTRARGQALRDQKSSEAASRRDVMS